MNKQVPKLRSVQKYHPEYPLNNFPSGFALKLGKEIVYLLATRSEPRLEGSDWEEIFARCIGAEWAPSNVGLDDVVLKQMAWGAKTVKNAKPFDARHVRLICGRNSPDYSYGVKNVRDMDIAELGEKIIDIWNARVADVRKKFSHVRTVVLLKGDDLSEVSVYEEDTNLFASDNYYWQWNDRGNFEGYEKNTNIHRFTWQPSGSQFTVISDVPEQRLKLRIKKPPLVDKNEVLKSIEFDESWIEVVK
jgi:hypothetical protein